MREGAVDPALAGELPGLGLSWLTCAVRPGRSPAHVRKRLSELSSRFRGLSALDMRRSTVPAAYRAFFRQVGLDPDKQRPPAEAAAVERLVAGSFRSQNIVDDALTIAVVETSVPVVAFDAQRLEGEPRLRLAAPGEGLGREADPPPVATGRIVVADSRSPVAVAFGAVAPGHGVTRRTSSTALVALRVPGVPAIHAEEALWTCAELLQSA